MMKVSFHQDDTQILIFYLPTNASKIRSRILQNREKWITVRKFNTPLSEIDITPRPKSLKL